MTKKSILILSCALTFVSGYSELLSPEDALGRISAESVSGRRVISAADVVLAETISTREGNPAIYVFNRAEGGSLLVSASDLTRPLIGYTDEGRFSKESVPPAMDYWMQEYAEQIRYAENNELSFKRSAPTYDYPADWTYIAPLVKTKWNQGVPYNKELPVSYYATGCVATAMAQIMKYWEYPEIGHGSNSYSFDMFGDIYSFSMNFDEQPFKWDLMLDEYLDNHYTDEQARAVAYLMKACGYATNMVYGPSSGTQVEYAAPALVDYFGYDNSIRMLKRYGYSASEWASILYDQLKNVGPVLYSGTAIGGLAHAFVADGYDGNGYFHINWGWSGVSNGFYSLDILTPPLQGTGGTTGGYNFSQGMIVDIKKSSGTPSYSPEAQLTLIGNLSAAVNGRYFTVSLSQAYPGNVVNTSPLAIDPIFGFCFENTASGDKQYAQAEKVIIGGQDTQAGSIPPGSFIYQDLQLESSFNSSLGNGNYKVSMVWKEKESENSAWQEFTVGSGCHDYFLADLSNGTVKIENLPLLRFTIDKAEILTPLYMRNPCQIEFTVSNKTDLELTQSVVPILKYEGKESFNADGQLVTAAPNSTAKVNLVFSFNQIAGGTAPTQSSPREYTLGAYDYGVLLDDYYEAADYGDSYYGDFGTWTMYRPSGAADSFEVVSIEIQNAEVTDKEGYSVFGIDNFASIPLSVTLKGTGEFLATPLSVVVCTREGGDQSSVLSDPVYEKNFENLIYFDNGQTSTETTRLYMTGYDVGQLYVGTVYYTYQSQRKPLGSFAFTASSGVEKAEAETISIGRDGSRIYITSPAGIENVDVYDSQGNKVMHKSAVSDNYMSIDLSDKAKGTYIVVVTDFAGVQKVMKTIL